jgi:polysaccharide export outer membrane protein
VAIFRSHAFRKGSDVSNLQRVVEKISNLTGLILRKLKGNFCTTIAFIAMWILASCGYKQNIMFKVPENVAIKQQVAETERNYIVQKNDYLKVYVYTNNGERIIDPDLKLLKDMPVQNTETRPDPDFLVNINGIAKFPMIGEIKVEGLTIRKAEELLQKEYAKFYTDPFVTLLYTNKRVTVLGGTGGKIIPLVNENVTLVEILALAGGVDNLSKAHNMRVIRGEEFFVADFSTIEGYQKTNMIMQHGDIVYVEPVRRPVSEAARDYGPILSLSISITTLIVVLIGL